MSDLQIALIAAGVAIVLAVWGYNKWQERQHRKIAERIFRGEQHDVLLGQRPIATPQYDDLPELYDPPLDQVRPHGARFDHADHDLGPVTEPLIMPAHTMPERPGRGAEGEHAASAAKATKPVAHKTPLDSHHPSLHDAGTAKSVKPDSIRATDHVHQDAQDLLTTPTFTPPAAHAEPAMYRSGAAGKPAASPHPNPPITADTPHSPSIPAVSDERAEPAWHLEADEGDLPHLSSLDEPGQESPPTRPELPLAKPEPTAPHIEPILDLPMPELQKAFAPGIEAQRAEQQRSEPVKPVAEPVAAAAPPHALDVGLPIPPLPEEMADDISDCLIGVDFAKPVAASAIWGNQARWAGHIGKRLSWIGFNDIARVWQPLNSRDASRYLLVVAALQLADRRGAATDAELSTFLAGVRDIAGQTGGVASWPKQEDVLAHARALDEFCASVDLQLGVNVVSNSSTPFAGTKLRGLAESCGMSLRADGCFHAVDDDGRTCFTLGNIGIDRFEADSLKSVLTHGVTLSLDVPRVAGGPSVFDAMLTVARQLTRGLDGALVDSQGHPLTNEMIATIRAKVSELQQKMARHHIVAGSPRALRLFS